MGKGKHYPRPYNIEAVWKNIKWEKGEGGRNFREENQDLGKWGWGRISSCMELYTTLRFNTLDTDLWWQPPSGTGGGC